MRCQLIRLATGTIALRLLRSSVRAVAAGQKASDHIADSLRYPPGALTSPNALPQSRTYGQPLGQTGGAPRRLPDSKGSQEASPNCGRIFIVSTAVYREMGKGVRAVLTKDPKPYRVTVRYRNIVPPRLSPRSNALRRFLRFAQEGSQELLYTGGASHADNHRPHMGEGSHLEYQKGATFPF